MGGAVGQGTWVGLMGGADWQGSCEGLIGRADGKGRWCKRIGGGSTHESTLYTVRHSNQTLMYLCMRQLQL